MAERSPYFKMVHVIWYSAQPVLCKVLQWGCRKTPNETWKMFVEKRNLDYNKIFSFENRQKIEKNQDERSFDITLLFTLIKFCCDDVASPFEWEQLDPNKHQLESCVKRIKDTRNKLFHGNVCQFMQTGINELKHKLEEIKSLLIKTLHVAGSLFKQDSSTVDFEIQKVKELFDKISMNSFTLEDIINFVARHGADEVREYCLKESKIMPLFFIEKGDSLDVTSVFTQLTVEEVKTIFQNSLNEQLEGNSVKYENILQLPGIALKEIEEKIINGDKQLQQKFGDSKFISELRRKPCLVLLEGVAGAGKTTILKHLMAGWANKIQGVKGIETFDLLLHMECRNRNHESLGDLIKSTMKETAKCLTAEKCVSVVKQMRPLILIDGIDEINHKSEKLLREILELPAVFICTTRPEKLEHLKKICPPHLWAVHILITGIPQENVCDFIKKYYIELQKAFGINGRGVENLLLYVKENTQMVAQLFKYPLNLMLFIYLYLMDPDSAVLITTATSLYIKLYWLLRSKIIERLNKKLLKDPLLEERIDRVFAVLHKQSFLALSMNEVIFSDQSFTVLKDICKDQKLPIEEVIFPILVRKVLSPETPTKEAQVQLSFPHKGLQEFWAAWTVLEELQIPAQLKYDPIIASINRSCITKKSKEEFLILINELVQEEENCPQSSKIDDIFCSLERRCPVQYNKYQNTLSHLTGLLEKANILQQHSEEIIGLLHLSGINTCEEWFDLVKETDYNSLLLRHISKIIEKEKWDVTDDSLKPCLPLLELCCPEEIKVIISSDPNDILEITSFVEAISKKSCDVCFNLLSSWKCLNAATCDAFLLPLLQGRCTLNEFSGRISQVDSFQSLPKQMNNLHLSLQTAAEVNNFLVARNNMAIAAVYLHVGAAVEPSDITVPAERDVDHLYISSVTNNKIEWAADLVAAIQDSKASWEFAYINFPHSSLTIEEFEELMLQLRKRHVRINHGLRIESPNIPGTEKTRLRRSSLKLLGCRYCRLADEMFVWT